MQIELSPDDLEIIIREADVNGGVKTGHGAEQKSATAAPA